MNISYRVSLTAAERDYLEAFTSQGRQRVRALKRAQILLLADGGVRREEEIVEALGGEQLDGVSGEAGFCGARVGSGIA